MGTSWQRFKERVKAIPVIGPAARSVYRLFSAPRRLWEAERQNVALAERLQETEKQKVALIERLQQTEVQKAALAERLREAESQKVALGERLRETESQKVAFAEQLQKTGSHAEALKEHLAAVEDVTSQLKSVVWQTISGENVSLAAADAKDPEEVDGLAVPPGLLRYLVAGSDDLDWFIRIGRLGMQTLTEALTKQGSSLDRCHRILDFGCGCGRVTRHLNGLADSEVHGTDLNAMAVEWCREHLRFGEFAVNPMAPPTAYGDDTFDLIYAFSVFTHLTEPMQVAWLHELRRILSPGGCLIVTAQGDKCTESLLTPEEQAEFRRGKLIVQEENLVGSNYCMTWHPEDYFRRLVAPYFGVVDFVPEGAKGNPPQDLYVLTS